MTDERFSFIEDVKTRKNIARSAAHKVSGAKSKKCNFPSDYLTRKKKQALNGFVGVWCLNGFYTWEDFLEMPQDIQQEYINELCKRWNVGLEIVSTKLFGKGVQCLWKYGKKNNLNFVGKGLRGNGAKKYNAIFTEAVKAWRGEDEAEEEPCETEETKTAEPVINDAALPEKPDEAETPTSTLKRVELEMADSFDYYLVDTIYSRFKGKRKITIVIEEVE